MLKAFKPSSAALRPESSLGQNRSVQLREPQVPGAEKVSPIIYQNDFTGEAVGRKVSFLAENGPSGGVEEVQGGVT